jgi:YopX protein
MTREIKFRAWDSHLKRIEDAAPIHIPSHWAMHGSRYTIMQFTGLHDSHGEEIYEGDILAPKWEAQWSEDLAAFIIKDRGSTGFDNLQLGLQGVIGEVIGNIYEKPELLTV